jgi:hypothetical protein
MHPVLTVLKLILKFVSKVVIPISVSIQVFVFISQLVVVLKLKGVDQDVVVFLLVFVENSTLVVVFLL